MEWILVNFKPAMSGKLVLKREQVNDTFFALELASKQSQKKQLKSHGKVFDTTVKDASTLPSTFIDLES